MNPIDNPNRQHGFPSLKIQNLVVTMLRLRFQWMNGGDSSSKPAQFQPQSHTQIVSYIIKKSIIYKCATNCIDNQINMDSHLKNPKFW